MNDQPVLPDPEEPVPGGGPEAAAGAPPSPETGAAEAPPPSPAPAAAPEGPVLARSPGWVPAAVTLGAVLLLEGIVVGRIQPGGEEGAARLVGDLASVSFTVGLLSLVAGYFAFLLSRTGVAGAIEGLVLSAAAVAVYGIGWRVLLGALSGGAADLFFVEPLGLAGRGAAVAAIVGLLVCVGVFAVCFRLAARIVWPYFRSGVALNVMAMVHLVVGLLGTVSALNLKFVPHLLGTGVDLTETGQFTLSDRTRTVLGKVEGELMVFMVDYGGAARRGSSVTGRVQDLLREYRAVTPRITYRLLDALRSPDDLRETLMEAGMSDVLGGLTGEEDCVVLGYRPPGEKLVARTKVVEITGEFEDTSALGTPRFRGEGILTNAVNEVVFVQRRVYFLEGHGERPISGGAAAVQSLGVLADALRGDNFAVLPLNLAREPAVPADADLVVVAAPATPIPGEQVEALRSFLLQGGSVLVFLEVPSRPGEGGGTGLEDLMGSFGLAPRRDAVIVSFLAEQTLTRGVMVTPTFQVLCTDEEFGRHPAMEALRGSSLVVGFQTAIPVLHAGEVPEGVDVDDLIYAPREIQGNKPFAAVLREGRGRDIRPEPGDILDRRMPVAVVAERRVGGTEKGAGRLLVFGDVDFVADLRLDSRSPAAVPANRTLVLNAVSWAVRRDVIAIDPKTVETEVVQLRPIDRELAFWVAVVALPLMALGLAVGVWWMRRR